MKDKQCDFGFLDCNAEYEYCWHAPMNNDPFAYVCCRSWRRRTWSRLTRIRLHCVFLTAYFDWIALIFLFLSWSLFFCGWRVCSWWIPKFLLHKIKGYGSCLKQEAIIIGTGHSTWHEEAWLRTVFPRISAALPTGLFRLFPKLYG